MGNMLNHNCKMTVFIKILLQQDAKQNQVYCRIYLFDSLMHQNRIFEFPSNIIFKRFGLEGLDFLTSKLPHLLHRKESHQCRQCIYFIKAQSKCFNIFKTCCHYLNQIFDTNRDTVRTWKSSANYKQVGTGHSVRKLSPLS